MNAIIRKQHPLWNEFPTLFDDLFNDWTSGSVKNKVPAVNVQENESAFELEFAAPGFDKDQFNISLENNKLMVSTEVKNESETKEKDYTRKEFHFQSFQRSFQLPKDQIKEDEINAKYENGILKVTLPKRMEIKAQTIKNIQIG